MPSPRRDHALIRALAAAGLLALAGLFAANTRAEEEPPPYPPPLSDELAPPAAVVSTPNLVVTISPLGAARDGKPLPPGAQVQIAAQVRNSGPVPLARVVLVARVEGLKLDAGSGWRLEGETLVAELPRLAAGATLERRFTVRIERAAPLPGATLRVVVEVRSDGGEVVNTEAVLKAADCAAAYHARFNGIRTGLIQDAKNEADAIRKVDPTWPRARAFAALGGKTGALANAERLAAYFLAQGGADGEFGRDPLRFNFVRWASDLTAYTSQTQNPALCSGAAQVVARYRDLIAPGTRRIETVRAAAASALDLARKATGAEANDDLVRVVGRAIEKARLKLDDGKPPLAQLAAARAALESDRKLDPAELEALSTSETAAVLAEAVKRIDRLGDKISGVLAAIATAAKEDCVCAY